MIRKKKVKIDYKVLKELLAIYTHSTNMEVIYKYGSDEFREKVSKELIIKANNILENS